MHMTFWFSTDLGNFLFDGFVVNTTRGMAAMAALLEIFKFWRIKAKQKLAMSSTNNGGSETSALLSGSRLRGDLEKVLHIAADVFMYFTQEAINWMVMLAVMGYNGYIFFSVLGGAGLGYALFGESVAHAKIQNVKLRAAMAACGDCQVKDGAEDNAAGQSDPPANALPIPSVSGSVSPSITVHCNP